MPTTHRTILSTRKVAPEDSSIDEKNASWLTKKEQLSSVFSVDGLPKTPDLRPVPDDSPQQPYIPGFENWHLLWKGKKSTVWRAQDTIRRQSSIVKASAGKTPDLISLQSLKSEYAMIQHARSNVGGGVSCSNVHDTTQASLKGLIQAFSFVNVGAGRGAIVMEDIAGQSLSVLMKEMNSVEKGLMNNDQVGAFDAASVSLASGFSLLEAVDIAVQICSALFEVHERQIIHKDINPNNIIISRTAGTLTAQLIDFSISSFASAQNAVVTVPEGTLRFMAPEQTEYEMDEMSLIHAHIARPVKSPSELCPDIPAKVSEVICKLMEKAPENRYQSAYGLLQDLRLIHRILQDHPLDVANHLLAAAELGNYDVPTTFKFPENLFGRESEVEMMVDLLESCGNERSSGLLVVEGASGIGKSMFVREIQRYIAAERGIFLVGKCDQIQTKPLTCFIQCFEEVIRKILSGTETDLQEWRLRILQRVPRCDLLYQYLPDLELITQSSPKHRSLKPSKSTKNESMATITRPSGDFNFSQSQIQINEAFSDLAAALTAGISAATQDPNASLGKSENDPWIPVCMFLDDLQWADLSTLNLLEFLIDSERCRNLIVIIAYRDNEVMATKGHPLMTIVDSISKKGASKMDRITLEPLNPLTVLKYVAATVGAVEPEGVRELADLVFTAT
ncbi:hypothetical protein HDU67_001689, partial [Dinochytrium kinnereticum]